jgi:hypothetical protein
VNPRRRRHNKRARRIREQLARVRTYSEIELRFAALSPVERVAWQEIADTIVTEGAEAERFLTEVLAMGLQGTEAAAEVLRAYP